MLFASFVVSTSKCLPKKQNVAPWQRRAIACDRFLPFGRIGGILSYMKDEAREKQEFDVFLSHNSQDKVASRVTDKRRGL